MNNVFKLIGLGLVGALLCACDAKGVCTGKQSFEQDTCVERKKSDCTSSSSDEPGVFHEFTVEPSLGPIRSRAMFGGHGVFDGRMLAMVTRAGALCLRADDGNRDAFTQPDLPQFFQTLNGSAA